MHLCFQSRCGTLLLQQAPTNLIHWRPVERWLTGELPPALRSWLCDQGSLSRRLTEASGNRFTVDILRQQIDRPRIDEARSLKKDHARTALIREVVLNGRSRPWVYARSVLPLSTLTGRLRALRYLDNRPLGEVLFNDCSMRRTPIEIARIPGALIPCNLAPGYDFLWGRRSRFYLDNKPLLVCEIFLPGFNP